VQEEGLAVIPFNPLAGGLLSGKYKLTDTLAAADFTLDSALKTRLDEVSSGFRRGDAGV
jgi:aryl-alcohol dehydrogenase-like predicted oxidoreductase